MSITGQVGHIVVTKQNGFGTAATPQGSDAIKITGDSLVSNNNPLVAEGEIGQGRDVSQMVPGGYAAAGAINGNLRARAANILLEGVLGTAAGGATATPESGTSPFVATGGTSPNGSLGYRKLTPGDDLPFYTIEKRIGATSPEQLVIQYQDTVINSLNVSVPAGALATFSANVIAAGEVAKGASATPVSPTYKAISDDLLVFHGGRILNGTTGQALTRDNTFQSVELAFNNNVAADEYTVRPSRFLRSLTEGIRSVEANVTMVFNNHDDYAKYQLNAASPSSDAQPGYSFYMGGMQLVLANFQATDDNTDLVGSNTLPTSSTSPVTYKGYKVAFSNDATPNNNSTTPLSGAQGVQFNIPRLAFTGFPIALASGRIVVTTSARALRLNTTDGGQALDICTAYVRPGNA